MNHTVKEDFEHFLSYSGLSKQPDDIRVALFQAFLAARDSRPTNPPMVEIEALCAYIEVDLENGVQINDTEWRESLERVRKWLDAVEKPLACEFCGHVSAKQNDGFRNPANKAVGGNTK